MNRVARKGLVTAMVAGGVLASAHGARADATADGEAAGSPGVLSGNSVQVPVSVPVNACGNTVSVVGLLNPAFGNSCANVSGPAARPAADPAGPAVHTLPAPSRLRPARHAGAPARESGARSHGRGAHAGGAVKGSPGVLAGNGLGLPLDIPLNVAGNSVDVVGIGNPAFGNTAVNGGTPSPVTPAPVAVTPTPAPAPAHTPIPAPPNTARATVDTPGPALAHTGASGLGAMAAGSAGLLLGGAVLYRRFRPGQG